MIDFSKILTRERRRKIGNAVLTPFSWFYGAGVWMRNTAFNIGLLKSEEFEVPVVSVGNITVGGTGKTPHVEYIVEQLCRHYKVGVLSRGYKRKTHGFILATDKLTPRDLGDEPYQIYQKFSGMITLAVCESRRKGIKEMLRINPEINLFVLDDAFQHRYVKPKVNILLIDYNRPPHNDKLLPLGTLREPKDRISKSDFVVVTKCPNGMTAIEKRMMIKTLDLSPWQQLFFTCVRYANPTPVFPINNIELGTLAQLTPDDLILGLTGIANHKPFVVYLRQYSTKLKVIHYNDHHEYTRDDFKYIIKVYNELEGKRKFIITTEKDAVRILNNPYFPPTMQPYIYYIPIRVAMVEDEDKDKNNLIDALVKKIEE